MPAADPVPGSGGETVDESFPLSNGHGHDHIYRNPYKNCSHPLAATKLINIQSSFSKENANPLNQNTNGISITHLKAVPLASYYKLHRVPSLSTMDGQELNDKETVPLPRRESTTEPPPERPVPNGIQSRVLDNVVRTPGRQPSPQPTHLSVPGSAHHRVLHETGSGYVAPKFEGKEQQMEQGT